MLELWRWDNLIVPKGSPLPDCSTFEQRSRDHKHHFYLNVGRVLRRYACMESFGGWRCCFLSRLDDYWQCWFCFCATCTSCCVCFPLCVQECTHVLCLFNPSERGCFERGGGRNCMRWEVWLVVDPPDILSPQFTCGFWDKKPPFMGPHGGLI